MLQTLRARLTAVSVLVVSLALALLSGIAFVVVVIGGMGSFVGALMGGLLVGLVQSLMSTIWPEGASLMIYGAMATVILLRPHGLFGRA